MLLHMNWQVNEELLYICCVFSEGREWGCGGCHRHKVQPSNDLRMGWTRSLETFASGKRGQCMC